ncbi:hypothetical protein ACS0TY_016353 [Phlomoides rotata]
MRNMHDLVMVSDHDCKDQLRMDRASFHKLCGLVRTFGGLKSSRNISVEEKVAMFLSILAHHIKNRCVKYHFKRSGQTLSKHFNQISSWFKHNRLMKHVQMPDGRNFRMAARGNVVAPNVDKGEVVRARRSWSKAEEDALIHCLIDIVNDGWKTKNGFKVGFLRELEKNMRKMLPGTDIVVNPHVHSKIHV